ncbi:hypothetical protein DFH07DRAFT_835453 [Mycena maculata]|uniref:F-box domain-containing protein n=1 Tax=Mycena maculata TaxID=230809 RepID=A0AAD7N2P0_9AGAR|nr:hypothetical protein DFH07DRAFT_835453 [Mycena maculata]
MHRPQTSSMAPQAGYISSGPVFPPEITDSIICQLESSLPTLRVCALVCRDWLPASRNIAHKSLRLFPRHLNTFLKLADSPYNTYAGAVRVVSFVHCSEQESISSFFALFPQFRHLESIHVHNSLLGFSIPTLPHVHTIFLGGMVSSSSTIVSDLLLFLRSFPHLKNLTLDRLGSVQAGEIPAPDPVPLDSSMKLDSLSVAVDDTSQLVPCLILRYLSPLARSLTLAVGFAAVGFQSKHNIIECISDYLRYLGTHLKDLTLPSSSDPFLAQRLDLRMNTALESIRFTCGIHSRQCEPFNPRVSPDLLELLERCHLESLKEMTLDVDSMVAMREHNFARLDQLSRVLGLPCYAGVAQIKVQGMSEGVLRHSWDEFLAAIRVEFPDYADRCVFVG